MTHKPEIAFDLSEKAVSKPIPFHTAGTDSSGCVFCMVWRGDFGRFLGPLLSQGREGPFRLIYRVLPLLVLGLAAFGAHVAPWP